MMSAAHGQPSRPRRIQAVALVAMVSLACATVRVPASGIPPSVPIRGDVPEPQVELWVESGKDVTPEEAARAAADARGALEQALAGRQLGDGGQLLVVRAQGVSRTGSRRTDQKAAIAGIVVAAVVVVAVAVVALVATSKSGGPRTPSAHPAPAPAAHAAPAPGAIAAAGVPAPAPAALPRPAPPTPGAPPRPVPVPTAAHPPGASGHGGAGVGFAFGGDVQIVVPPAPNGAPPPASWGELVETGPLEAPPPPAPVPAELVLPPPPPLEVHRRGFFAGDSIRLELTLVDRATMQPLWVKVVEGERDPRDAKAVRALLDGALGDPGGWEPAAPPAPAAAPAS